MTKSSLLQKVEREAKAVGLQISNLSGMVDNANFGNEIVTGEIRPLSMRFIRDRGQDWLDVGPINATPPRFYSFRDVQIALGWKSIPEILDMREVEPLGDVLKSIASQWQDILTTLSAGPTSFGWKLVEKAAHDRGEAFVARLR